MIGFDFSIIIDTWPILWEGIKITLKITVLAVILGMLLGTVLAVARLSPLKPLRWLAMAYIGCFRSIPLVMVLSWFYLIVPNLLKRLLNLSPGTDVTLVSAIIAFVLFEAAYYAEIIRAGINSVSRGQAPAGLALGMTRGQVMRLILLPHAFRAMAPLLLTQGIILFQDTSLVYLISLGDYFRTATNIGKTNGFEPGMVLFGGFSYFLVCLAASSLVDRLKKRLLVKKRKI